MFAFTLATTGLAYFSWRVYDLHINSSPIIEPISAPIVFPTNGDTSSCNADRLPSGSRLNPKIDGKLMAGYSLNWNLDTPTLIKARLGNTPAPVV
jgi:hypothetical protein